MNSIWLVIEGAWVVRILLNLLSYIHLWYVKEYRFDRMIIHFGTPQGKKLLMIPFRRPPVSPKTILIGLSGVCGLYLIYAMTPGFIMAKLLVADLLTFPIVSLLVFVTKIPTLLYHWILIQRAVAKLRAHAPMIVIGVTGSYGKTSTKEILSTLLEKKYKTLKTSGSKNSPIAIAELVLRDLQPDTEVFIVEMGAYKKGEIAYMCQMVKPEIGIVTAINAQHQDLFGSIENTVEAKYELIEGLTGRKIAIMNQDNPFVVQMAERASAEGKIVYGYSTKKAASYQAIDIRTDKTGVQFALVHDKKKTPLSAQLFGLHQASNILAGVIAAQAVGMTIAEIAKASSRIRPFDRTMLPREGINGSRFIDDTYNNNPDAAIAALEYLQAQPGRKILVFQPMVELGALAIPSHQMVAEKAGSVASEIILTNESFMDIFEKYRGEARVSVLNPKSAAVYLRKIITKEDVVLFKGKEAGRVLQLTL